MFDSKKPQRKVNSHILPFFDFLTPANSAYKKQSEHRKSTFIDRRKI